MPSSDYKVEIVTDTGEADMSVSVVGDQVVDISGSSPGDVLVVAPDGETLITSPSATPGAHAATHADGGSDEVTLTQAQITGLTADLALKAPLASPTFTGTVTLADGVNLAVGTGTGTQIGTGTTQKIGFYGATPVTQPAGNSDVLASLVTLGLRAASSNPPLNLGTGTVTAGTFTTGSGFTADSNGHIGLVNGISNGVLLRVGGAAAHPDTNTTIYGVVSNYLAPSTATVASNVFYASVRTAAASFTLADARGLYVETPNIGAGSAITTATGVGVASQAAAGVSTSIGLQINAGSTYAAVMNGGTTANLWLNSNTASVLGGIALGTARDTPIYRAAANAVVVGSAQIGEFVASGAGLIYNGLTVGTDYAILQDSVGNTYVNAATSRSIQFRNNNVNVMTLSSSQLTFSDAKNIAFNATTGTKIGTATTDKFAFHNATPVAQRAGAAQAAVATTGATNITPFGYTTAAQADAIVTLVNEIRATLVEKGLMKGSA